MIRLVLLVLLGFQLQAADDPVAYAEVRPGAAAFTTAFSPQSTGLATRALGENIAISFYNAKHGRVALCVVPPNIKSSKEIDHMLKYVACKDVKNVEINVFFGLQAPKEHEIFIFTLFSTKKYTVGPAARCAIDAKTGGVSTEILDDKIKTVFTNVIMVHKGSLTMEHYEFRKNPARILKAKL